MTKQINGTAKGRRESESGFLGAKKKCKIKLSVRWKGRMMGISYERIGSHVLCSTERVLIVLP